MRMRYLIKAASDKNGAKPSTSSRYRPSIGEIADRVVNVMYPDYNRLPILFQTAEFVFQLSLPGFQPLLVSLRLAGFDYQVLAREFFYLTLCRRNFTSHCIQPPPQLFHPLLGLIWLH